MQWGRKESGRLLLQRHGSANSLLTVEDDRFCTRTDTPWVQSTLLLCPTSTVHSVFMSSPCIKLWGDSTHWPLSGHIFTNTPLWSWGLSVKRTHGWGRGRRKSVNCLNWSDSRKRDVSQFFCFVLMFFWVFLFLFNVSQFFQDRRKTLSTHIGDYLSPENTVSASRLYS